MTATASPEQPAVAPLLTRKPWLILGESRATFYRGRSAGLRPAPIDTGTSGSRPVWRVSDLVRWVESRKPDKTIRVGPQSPKAKKNAINT